MRDSMVGVLAMMSSRLGHYINSPAGTPAVATLGDHAGFATAS
jgi:hypothetical protein